MSGSWTRRELALLATTVAVVAIALALRFESLSRTSPAGPAIPRTTPDASPSSPARSDATAQRDAFARVLIRNVGTVPFEEIFELLRSAPAEVRTDWVRQLAEMPRGPQRSAAISSFYKTYVQLDPRGAAASISMLQDPNALWLAADAMIGAAPSSAMPEIAAMLTTLPRDIFYGGADRFDEVISNWSRVDPVAAAKFVETHPTFPVGSLLTNWAQMDPEAALEWFYEQRKPDPSSNAWSNDLRSLVEGWFEKDKAAAVAFTVANSAEDGFEEAIRALAHNLFFKSPDEARDFLAQVPSESRKMAVNAIVGMSTGLTLGLADEWKRNPRMVAEWILTLPEDSRDDALGDVLANWRREDDIAPLRWIDQLPADTRDRAIVSYTGSAQEDDHSETLRLAMTIRDTGLRESALRDYLHRRFAHSPVPAVKLLSESSLSDGEKKYLAQFLPSADGHE